jgi:hypothetical protein
MVALDVNLAGATAEAKATFALKQIQDTPVWVWHDRWVFLN